MALTSGFYNSKNHDRKYNAAEMSRLFDGIINDGVFMNVGESFAVKANSGMGITVAEGRGWFNATWTNNDSKILLIVDNADLTLNRIDTVVLEVNKNEDVRANSIKIIKGIPATSPINPTLTKNDLIIQYPLAYIYVGIGATSITDANITNLVGTAVCPYITSVLKATNLDHLYSQWEAEFKEWFNNLEYVLDGDVAGHLQNQLNHHDEIITPVRVGDILKTSRTDLDDSWALCNGGPFSRSDYGELADTLPLNPLGGWQKHNITNELACVDKRGYVYYSAYDSVNKTITIKYSKDGVNFITLPIYSFPSSGTITGQLCLAVNDDKIMYVYYQSGVKIAWCSWDGDNITSAWTIGTTGIFAYAAYSTAYCGVRYNLEQDMLYCVLVSESAQGSRQCYAIAPNNMAVPTLKGTFNNDSDYITLADFVVYKNYIGVLYGSSGYSNCYLKLSKDNGATWVSASLSYHQYVKIIEDPYDQRLIGYYGYDTTYNIITIGSDGVISQTSVSDGKQRLIINSAFAIDGVLYSAISETSGTLTVNNLYKITSIKPGASIPIVYSLIGTCRDAVLASQNAGGSRSRCKSGNEFIILGLQYILTLQLPTIPSEQTTNVFIKVKE